MNLPTENGCLSLRARTKLLAKLLLLIAVLNTCYCGFRLNRALTWKEPLGATGILANNPLPTAILGAATLYLNRLSLCLYLRDTRCPTLD